VSKAIFVILDARVYKREVVSLFSPLTFALVMETVVTKQNTTETEMCMFLREEWRGEIHQIRQNFSPFWNFICE
jgi:hypothetical protein